MIQRPHLRPLRIGIHLMTLLDHGTLLYVVREYCSSTHQLIIRHRGVPSENVPAIDTKVVSHSTSIGYLSPSASFETPSLLSFDAMSAGQNVTQILYASLSTNYIWRID